jgi:pimeloyl-ACP methyl ester carboxylesterase
MSDTSVRRVARGDLVFDVRVGGPPHGDPVVLLHGFPQDGTSWDAVVPHLHAAGLRTIVPDQRGYSPDARPKTAGAYRMANLVDDVMAVLDHLDVERAHVVGHDWGGGVAWTMGAARPDRVASLVVVSTPHPDAMMRAIRTSRQARQSWYFLLFRLPFAERLVAWRLADDLVRTGLPTDRVDHYVARMAEPGALTGALNWYRALSLRTGTWPDPARDDLDPAWRYEHLVTVPTTYVWGARDPALGRTAAEMTAEHVRTDYRFVVLDDAGHWIPETHPEPLARCIVERIVRGRA